MPVALIFTMGDNNGRKAEVRFWLPDVASLENIDAWPASIEAGLVAVSDARIIKAEALFTFALATNRAPAPDSDVRTFLALCYRNDNEAAAILFVPSPGPLPLDLLGAYRGVRLGVAAATVSGLLPALGKLAQGVLTPGGTSWPATFRVGGITRGR